MVGLTFVQEAKIFYTVVSWSALIVHGTFILFGYKNPNKITIFEVAEVSSF